MFLTYWKITSVATIILIISIIPMPQGDNQNSIPHLDKIVHFLMYFGLSLVLTAALTKTTYHTNIYLPLYIIAAGTLYGGIIEIMQEFFTNYRSGEIDDGITNCLGVSTGYYVYNKWRKLFIFKWI